MADEQNKTTGDRGDMRESIGGGPAPSPAATVGTPNEASAKWGIPRQDELQQKCDEYLAGWKRALADYENLQKENAKLREDDRRRIRMNVAHDLLPVIDNFEQAMKFAPKELPESMKSWFAGVSHIVRQFADVLASLGITPIDAVGHTFDPNLHESGGSRHVDDMPVHVIVEEIVRGYKIGDIVLRPAKVIVNE